MSTERAPAASELHDLIARRSNDRRAILVRNWPGLGVRGALLDALHALRPSECVVWATAGRLQADQVRARLRDSGLPAPAITTGIDLRSLRNMAAHGKLPTATEGPLVVATTIQLLSGSAGTDLAQFLPQVRLFVADGALGQAFREHPLWERAQDQLVLADGALDLDFQLERSTQRRQVILDWRPPASRIASQLQVQVLTYTRSFEERALLEQLPPGLRQLERSSRGALRDVLERVCAQTDPSDVPQDAVALSPDAAERLLDELDELPVDPRVAVLAELASDDRGELLVPVSGLRSASYFAAGLAARLGEDAVSVDINSVSPSTRVVVTNWQRLRGMEVTAPRSVWLDVPPTPATIAFLLTRVLAQKHQLTLLEPADPTPEEEVQARALRKMLEVLPETLGRLQY